MYCSKMIPSTLYSSKCSKTVSVNLGPLSSRCKPGQIDMPGARALLGTAC